MKNPLQHLLILVILVAFLACSRQPVHWPAMAGIFYTSNQSILSNQIDNFLKEAPKVQLPGHLVGLLVPHASYNFSGQVAAQAYKLLEGQKYETVVIIGTNQFRELSGVSVFPRGVYKTILGDAKVDEDICTSMINDLDFVKFHPKIHEREYVIEMQLHFLKKVLTSFKLVPILIGTIREDQIDKLTTFLLKKIKDKNVLIITTSNLSAYPEASQADVIDKATLSTIALLNPKAFAEYRKEIGGQRIPHFLSLTSAPQAIIAGMLLTRKLGADGSKIIAYSNSSTATGDSRKVLGYGSVAFYKKHPTRD